MVDRSVGNIISLFGFHGELRVPKPPKPPKHWPPVTPLVRERPPVIPSQLLPSNGSHSHARLPFRICWSTVGGDFGSLLALLVCDRHVNDDGVCSVYLQSMCPHATTITQGVIQESRPRSGLHQPLEVLLKTKVYFRTSNIHAMWFGNFRVPRLGRLFLQSSRYGQPFTPHLRPSSHRVLPLATKPFPSDSFCLSNKTSTSLKY